MCKTAHVCVLQYLPTERTCSSHGKPAVGLGAESTGLPARHKHMHTQECCPQATETCCHSKWTVRECSNNMRVHEREGDKAPERQTTVDEVEVQNIF